MISFVVRSDDCVGGSLGIVNHPSGERDSTNYVEELCVILEKEGGVHYLSPMHYL